MNCVVRILLLVIALQGCQCNRAPPKGLEIKENTPPSFHGLNAAKGKAMNRLKHEKSPYLKQHADNPIHWYAWSEEAFKDAKDQNKLIFLSIGYSTCHWCHVMAHESFEDQQVADFLNAHFIAIKVDREERPDVDSIYMDAVVAMNGQGGWPMSVFLTPDRVPFFGGTYFRKEQFLSALSQLQNHWEKDPKRITEAGSSLLEWLNKKENSKQLGTHELGDKIFIQFAKNFKNQFDDKNGGKGGAPKFPPASDLRVLLRVHRRSENKEALKQVTLTLDKMGQGGIYDHLAGGFHRYSTDDRWLIPHYEKMLYDQAMMGQAYLEGYLATKNEEYLLIAKEIADYVLEQMQSKEGGFYSAEDADSEGMEGKFYVWEKKELDSVFSDSEKKLLNKLFDIREAPNFEGHYYALSLNPDQFRENRDQKEKDLLAKLKNIRAKRIRPLRDEKILTSWNALMISFLSRLSRLESGTLYLKAAEQATNFILFKMKSKEGTLYRRYALGEAKLSGYLDDYAFFIDALIELYQSDFNEKWMKEAVALQKKQDELFLDTERNDYYFSQAGDPTLIKRQKEFYDNVEPSGVSVTAFNLLRLSDLTLERGYLERFKKLVGAFPAQLEEYPQAYSHFLIALDYFLDFKKEVAVIGKESDPLTQAQLKMLRTDFYPNLVVAFTQENKTDLGLLKNKTMLSGKSTVYVCEGHACKLPTSDVEVLNQQLKHIKLYK